MDAGRRRLEENTNNQVALRSVVESGTTAQARREQETGSNSGLDLGEGPSQSRGVDGENDSNIEPGVREPRQSTMGLQIIPPRRSARMRSVDRVPIIDAPRKRRRHQSVVRVEPQEGEEDDGDIEIVQVRLVLGEMTREEVIEKVENIGSIGEKVDGATDGDIKAAHEMMRIGLGLRDAEEGSEFVTVKECLERRVRLFQCLMEELA